MNNGYNKPLNEQLEILHEILKQDIELYDILEKLEKLNLPNYYVGSGAIFQTVWNYIYGFDIGHGISDLDVVYFDEDLSETKEKNWEKTVVTAIGNSRFNIDVVNEARVHLWYEKSFGFAIPPFTSSEDAISKWPTNVSSIGARLETGKLIIFAPFGLNDIFGGVVRANKTLINEEIYLNKAVKWKSKWCEIVCEAW